MAKRSKARTACAVPTPIACVACIACIASNGCNEVAPSSPDAGAPVASWTTKRPLPVERFEGFAVERGGSVLFVGGITGVLGDIRTANPSTRVDVYDPARDAWSDGPSLPMAAPKHHLAVAQRESSVYVLGGFDGIIGKTANEPFIPIGRAFVLEGDAWRELASPPRARGGATAQSIGGKIYVAGGAPNEGEAPFAELDVYDIASDAWSVGPPMPTAREHVASCAIEGKFLVVGGWIGPGNFASRSAEWFDPATGAWEKLPDMPTARGGLAAATAVDGCHVLGGEDWKLPLPGTFATHEIFEPRERVWKAALPMPTARHGFGLTRLGDALYAIGGGPAQGNSYTSVVEVFGR